MGGQPCYHFNHKHFVMKTTPTDIYVFFFFKYYSIKYYSIIGLGLNSKVRSISV